MSPDFDPGLATVLVTTFQRANYIRQTVNSVLSQTYRPVELIVVDDGSTDNTGEILASWARRLPRDDAFRIRYSYQENGGAPLARNRALRMSKGEFIQEIGSDDLIHPSKLAVQIGLLNRHSDCQSAWSPLRRFTDPEECLLLDDEATESIEHSAQIATITGNVFDPQFLPSAGLHRRSVFFNAGPWKEGLARWQDLEYQVRMAFCINRYVRLEKPLYFFRQHDGDRIHSLYAQARGIASGFESLSQVEKNLCELNSRDEAADREISKFYVTLAILAARTSSRRDLAVAVSGAIRRRTDVLFRARLRLFHAFASLVSGPLAVKLSESYTKSKR